MSELSIILKHLIPALQKIADEIKDQETRNPEIDLSPIITTIQSKEKEKEYLSIDEIVELLHLSKSTIYKMTSQKEIPHMKLGSRLYFSKEKILEWLKEHEIREEKE